eukprot:2705541-Pyramimonas_sp.AAC.1
MGGRGRMSDVDASAPNLSSPLLLSSPGCARPRVAPAIRRSKRNWSRLGPFSASGGPRQASGASTSDSGRKAGPVEV